MKTTVLCLATAVALAVPGDENCDGRVDLADPVTLLLFLFRGGEPPCNECELQLQAEINRCRQQAHACDIAQVSLSEQLSECRDEVRALVGVIARLEEERAQLIADLEACRNE